MFFIIVKMVQNQMKLETRRRISEKHLKDINDEAINIFEMIPRSESANRLSETHNRNYCYDIVFQEINSIYSES